MTGPRIKRAVFADVFGQVERRIHNFRALPVGSFARLAIQRELRNPGAKRPEPA